MVWLAAVETWKDEILTDFSAAEFEIPTEYKDSERSFFLLVFLSPSTEFDVVARALSLHEQCVFCFSNVLPPTAQLGQSHAPACR